MKGSLHENTVAMAGHPASKMTRAEETRAEEWEARKQAWVDRLDTDDPDALDALCAEIDEAVGQGEAWTRVAEVADCVRNHPCCVPREDVRTAARAAILEIPMPETDDA